MPAELIEGAREDMVKAVSDAGYDYIMMDKDATRYGAVETRDEGRKYAAWLKGCLDVLPEHIVVHRITGDGAKKDLIAPLWSADKKRVLNYLHKILNAE